MQFKYPFKPLGETDRAVNTRPHLDTNGRLEVRVGAGCSVTDCTLCYVSQLERNKSAHITTLPGLHLYEFDFTAAVDLQDKLPDGFNWLDPALCYAPS